MARIAGIDLPKNKHMYIALTRIYGVGTSLARKILEETKIDPIHKVKDLTEKEISVIARYIEDNVKVEGELRRKVSQNIKRCIEIGCYRGIRHRRGLPVRGQRTHTNARTRKGPRKTVAIRRKKE